MAKTETEKKNDKTPQKEKPTNKNGGGRKKGGKKGGKKKEIEYQPGMSYLYEPCPHRVWTPKPGERDKSEPRGVGSPWYEPVRKKEEVHKEEEEKRKKKEEKAAEKRQEAYDTRQKKKEEEEKKRKEEENKKEEQAKKKEEERQKREKQKKKKEKEKRKKQDEQRMKDKEKKKRDEEGKGKQTGNKEEDKLQASYLYEPCPHKVYTPGPGERDLADPRGIGSPWYVPIRKKEHIDKLEVEKEEQDKQKRREERKKRQKEKKEQVEEERKLEEKKKANEERRVQRRREEILKEIQIRREERELEDLGHEEMGMGVRESRTDFTPELIWMMDFITEVDEKERERRGDALRWKKQEIEAEIETHLAKEAYINDFREIVSTFVEAEWLRADNKLKKLQKDERRNRRKMLKNMDPLAKDLFMEGKRFKNLYKAATGHKGKGEGEGPSALEDKMVGMIMQQMDTLDSSSNLNMISGMFFK